MHNFLLQLSKEIRKKSALSFLLFLCFQPLSGQSQVAQKKYGRAIELLCKNRLDERFFTPEERKEPEVHTLLRLNASKRVSYENLLQIVKRIQNHKDQSGALLGTFSDQYIKTPTSKKQVNLDFVRLKTQVITEFRNQNLMDVANSKQQELRDYIESIKIKNDDYAKAKIYLETHDVVLAQIRRDLDESERMSLSHEKTARALKDTSLIIQSLYYLCDTYVFKEMLSEFIEASEESARLDSLQLVKSDYFLLTQMHLVDAYIFEGNHPERSLQLLKNLHQLAREDSYAFFFKYLASIDPAQDESLQIFELWEVQNILELFEKAKAECEHQLYPNDYYQLLREASHALINFGEVTRGVKAMEEANAKLKKIYTQDLTVALAEHENEIKKREIEFEREKDTLQKRNSETVTMIYKFAFVTVGFLLIILLVLFVRKMRQNKKLRLKNEVIQRQEQEKALLMKELHHRVKNNFQIISSLFGNQIRSTNDARVIDVLTDSKSRVKSMALAHEKLYGSREDALLHNYVDSLCNFTRDSFNATESKIELIIDKSIVTDVDRAVPIGLILNELLTNSMKHARDENGKVEIAITGEVQEDNLRITYSDSGSGLLAGEFEKSASMGLTLIKRLTLQLKGTVTNSKATFELHIPHVIG